MPSVPLNSKQEAWLKNAIRDVPDFPRPGIIYKDLTPVFKDPACFKFVLDAMIQKCIDLKPAVIAGIEARGFILGPTIAYRLGIGFIPIRKSGKLPYKVEKITYDLEYGSDTIEIHADAVQAEDRVVIIDDLLATGGTAAAACELLKILGANVVGIGFIVELAFLAGRKRLPNNNQTEIFSLVQY